MKIAYIHSTEKVGTGAHYINDLIVSKLREVDVEVQSFYPKFILADMPIAFKGVNNILFFYSLLERHEEILKCDIIQGTTYTPIAFLQFAKPVVSHFGSSNHGFLKAVPRTSQLESECRLIMRELKRQGHITELDLKTNRPLHDISTIERYAAQKADHVIATSEIVKQDLLDVGIPTEKIEVIHNAIEDYWFETERSEHISEPHVVFLGRIGEDPFTLKLKGADRMIHLMRQFPSVRKLAIVMSRSKPLITYLSSSIPNTQVESNLIKTEIPAVLAKHRGSILLLTSRYEGFSLSLIEGMSQGLVPVSFPVGCAPEVIRNGENGFLVHTIQEAESAVRLLLDDDVLRHRLSVNAECTAQGFQSKILTGKLMELYARILRVESQKAVHV